MATYINTEFDLPSLLTRIRERRGLTQDKLSQLADVDRSSLAKYETGRQMPRLGILIQILEAMNLRLVIAPMAPPTPPIQ